MSDDLTDRETFSSLGMSYSPPLENLQRPPSGDTKRDIVTSQQCFQTPHHTITEEAEPNEEKEIEETISKGSYENQGVFVKHYSMPPAATKPKTKSKKLFLASRSKSRSQGH